MRGCGRADDLDNRDLTVHMRRVSTDDRRGEVALGETRGRSASQSRLPPCPGRPSPHPDGGPSDNCCGLTSTAVHEHARELLIALDRRTLLKSAVGTAATLALAAALPGCGSTPPEAMQHLLHLQFFRPEEGYVLERFAARILSPHPGRPTVEEIELVARIDQEISWLRARIDPRLGDDLKQLLKLVEYGPFVIGLMFRPFTRLSDRDQDSFLQRWEQHRFATLRLAFRGLRELCVFTYLCDDRTWPSVHYSGPWLTGGLENLEAWRRQSP